MGETKISSEIIKMLRAEFGDIAKLTRHQCGIAKGFNGGFVNLGEKFWPDYVGFTLDGRFLGIEVKDPNGKTDKKRLEGQDRLRELINNCGGYCIQTNGVQDCREKMLKIRLLILENCGIMKIMRKNTIFEKETKK